MKRHSFPLIATIALSLLARGGSADEAPAPDTDPKIPFEKYELENGLEVILHQDRAAPVVYVSIWYHVGSGDETAGKSGFAHLFEHMMFQGAKHIGEDVHFPLLRGIGVTTVNGTTNTERTNYYEEVPSNQLETVLWLESDRMGYLLPLVSEKSLENQRQVVRNERRQNYDDAAYGKTRFALAAALWPEGHPLHYPTIGLHEDIENAKVDDVKAFFSKWYVPSNATLVIAGDFDVDETKKLVDKWFGSFPKTARPAQLTTAQPVIKKSTRATIEDPFATLRRVQYAWHTPTIFTPGDAELDVVATALGRSGTGRLYKILVLDKQLARSVSVAQSSGRSSQFQILVDLRPEADLAEVEKIIGEEVEKVRKDGVTQKELDRAIVGYESESVWGLESLQARAEQLQTFNHYTGNPDYMTINLDRYRKTTREKIKQAAVDYLARDKRVEVITMPMPKKAAPAAAEKGAQ
jgi:zinc protease